MGLNKSNKCADAVVDGSVLTFPVRVWTAPSDEPFVCWLSQDPVSHCWGHGKEMTTCFLPKWILRAQGHQSTQWSLLGVRTDS